MTKPKKLSSKPTAADKKEFIVETVVFDEDNTWKNYITKNIFDCLASLYPPLIADIDKSVPPEFLEQELSNILKGKYKMKGKEKKTDKLVKLCLLTGEDYYVFVHIEVQNKLEDDFGERIYIYRSLISMKYNTQNISTFVIFTGKSPSEKHKIFSHECYGSVINFQYNSYVISDQNADDLEKSNNMFDLAVLAAKYTLDTEGNARKRLIFKKKLFELAYQKQFSLEKIEELISFVFDYMLLSEDLEDELKEFLSSSSLINSEEMVVTKGQYRLAQLMTEVVYGKSYEAMLAEKEAVQQKTIKALLEKDFSPEKIADLLEFDLDYVLKVAKNHSNE